MNIRKLFATRPWIIAAGILLSVALWMLTGQSGDPPAPAATTPDAQPPAAVPKVRVRVQQAEQVMRYVTLRGSTAPARRVELKAETAGRVTDIGARRGQAVETGGLIVRLDERDRYARLEEARATVRQWEKNYQGQLDLQRDGYVSDTNLAETLASLERARAELKRAELDLQYMRIRAPFDGILQERLVEVGDFVQSGDPIALFVETDPLVVSGSIAEIDAPKISVGAVGEARLATGDIVEGRVRYIAPVAEQSTRTFKLELEVANPQGALPAGVTAEIRIPVGQVWAQKVSPALLTLNDEGEVGIKIVESNGRVGFYPADVSLSDGDGVWVSGLPTQATIITVGQGFVRPGEFVQAIHDDSSGPALAAGSEL